MKDKILELLKQLPEVYQDVELNGEIIAKGKRDCEERWNLIKDHIKPHDVVLDLGSSLGYYSKKIAQTYPDCLVISFESDPIMCEIQSKMFEEEGIYNVIVCNYRLGKEDLIKWAQYVELFDTTLALAVLHHYPKEDLEEIWESLKKLSNLQICELASEEQACGGEAKAESRRLVLQEETTSFIGNSKSHMSNVNREFWQTVFSKKRTNLDAFFGVSHSDRHRFEVSNGKINGKYIIKGVNVWNLLHFNIVWPLPKWWVNQAYVAYESLVSKSDVRPWNLLVCSTGLKAIDYTDKFDPEDKASFHLEDLVKLDEIFLKMKPIDLWK